MGSVGRHCCFRNTPKHIEDTNVFVYNVTGVGFFDIVVQRESFFLQLSFHRNHTANLKYIKKERDMSYGLERSAAHPTTMHHRPGPGGPAEPRVGVPK